MKRKIMALIVSAAMAASMLAGCGTVGGDTSKKEEEEQSSQSTESTEGKKEEEKLDDSAQEELENSDGKVYKIGICQQLEHQALDAATEGFKAALV